MLAIGINEGINSSVVLMRDGQVVLAVQEERVCRQKEFVGFPQSALAFALAHAGVKPSDASVVCLSNTAKRITNTRDSFLRMYDRNASGRTATVQGMIKGQLLRSMPDGLPDWMQSARGRSTTTTIERVRAAGFVDTPIVQTDHHLNHAASAYYGCRADPDSPHLVMTADGGGDGLCAAVYLARDGRMELLAQTEVGHSLGNVYSCATHFMGMRPHEHEYKLMGLAAYADPDYAGSIRDYFRDRILWLDPLDPLLFRRKIPEATGLIGPRLQRELIRTRFDNLAGGLQMFTEDLMVAWVKAAIERTGVRRVVAAGGVFMNVKANKRIAEETGVEYFDVFPSCGDETLPFGALWHWFAHNTPERGRNASLDRFWLGPSAGYDLEEAKQRFAGRVVAEKLADPAGTVAELLAKGTVVARCSGPMEFGARALGNRSILADPANPAVVPLINKMIKQRDFWMPFAPAMMAECVHDYISVPPTLPKRISPFMMHTFDTTSLRDSFIAGVHAHDGTARAQIVSREEHPAFHEVISKFRALTGKGVVLNTSFNIHGHPIVMGACDAVDVLLNSGLTHLLVEDHLFTKIS